MDRAGLPYHFVYDERWRIVAVYRADTTTGDLDDDPKERLIYPATNPDESTTLEVLKDVRVIHQVRGGIGLDGHDAASYNDVVILREGQASLPVVFTRVDCFRKASPKPWQDQPLVQGPSNACLVRTFDIRSCWAARCVTVLFLLLAS